MTHTSAPVPFILYSGEVQADQSVAGYDEFSAAATGLFVEEGFKLMIMMKG